MSNALIRAVQDSLGGAVDYLPYNINDTIVTYGTPPIPLKGLEYVMATHNNAQVRLIMSLTAKGVFVGNLNGAGIIEVGLMADCASAGAIQAYSFTGVPMPIFSTDAKTGGTSLVAAAECRLIKTPPWRRALAPGITIFTFSTPRLIINHGVRQTE
ncbi:hypothetical protein KAR91_53390 [Candidatus Pacearchaeota archaeon]|nr:hypothetical protein [Candidatus Pacearchaeota archaeon]